MQTLSPSRYPWPDAVWRIDTDEEASDEEASDEMASDEKGGRWICDPILTADQLLARFHMGASQAQKVLPALG